MKEAKIFVKRFDPNKKETYYQEYKVPYDTDTVILEALIYIKENIDRTLSFRYSCRMAVCGSCGAVVNKRPVLMCESRIEEFKQPLYIEPLYNFRVIKDLVVDIEPFIKKLQIIQPYIKIEEEKIKENIIRQEEIDIIKYSSSCINCTLCYSACPVFGGDEEFLGPAALALLFRYINDPRTKDKEEKLKIASSKNGVWKCEFIGECSNVCPKNVDPAYHIQKLKIALSLKTIGILKI